MNEITDYFYNRHNIFNQVKEKKCKRAKWLSEVVLQIAENKKRSKRQRRKGKIYPSECTVPKKSKER